MMPSFGRLAPWRVIRIVLSLRKSKAPYMLGEQLTIIDPKSSNFLAYRDHNNSEKV